MPTWLMKTGDDTYREWSTVVDAWMSEPMGRDAALQEHDEERVRFTDQHLCSCRARSGDVSEVRTGRVIETGAGALAYHFDTYADVARFCRTQDEMWADEEAPGG